MTWHPVSSTAELPATTPMTTTMDWRPAVFDAFSRGPGVALLDRDYARAVDLASHEIIQHDELRQVYRTTLRRGPRRVSSEAEGSGDCWPQSWPHARPRRWPRKGGIGADFMGLSGTRRVAGRVPGRVPGEGGATPRERGGRSPLTCQGRDQRSARFGARRGLSTRPSPRTGNVWPRARRQTSVVSRSCPAAPRTDGAARSSAGHLGGGSGASAPATRWHLHWRSGRHHRWHPGDDLRPGVSRARRWVPAYGLGQDRGRGHGGSDPLFFRSA